MNDMQKNEVARQVLHMIEGQKFADWYNEGGDLGDSITGEREVPKEKLLEFIKRYLDI